MIRGVFHSGARLPVTFDCLAGDIVRLSIWLVHGGLAITRVAEAVKQARQRYGLAQPMH
jgi:hypothetical protein